MLSHPLEIEIGNNGEFDFRDRTQSPPKSPRKGGNVVSETKYLKKLANSDFWDLFWISDPYIHCVGSSNIYREYNLSFLQKVFVTLEFPESCTLASIISNIHIFIILFNVASVIASSFSHQQYTPDECLRPACNNDPDLCPGRMICAPRAYPYFAYIDGACGAFFAIHFLMRICLNPIMPPRLSGAMPSHWDETEMKAAMKENRDALMEPEYSEIFQFVKYLFSVSSFVDISTIILAFLIAANKEEALHDDRYIRAFETTRLLLVMRLNVNGRLVVDMLSRTMHYSQEAFIVLAFYFGLLVLFFSALVYVVEEGVFTINEDFPNGNYLRANGFGGKQVTNFDSLPNSIYFVIVTICTVGYGDISPSTAWGRFFACAIALCGVVVTALPISVISSAFAVEYERYLKRKVSVDNIRNTRHKRKVEIVLNNFRMKNALLAATIVAKCPKNKNCGGNENGNLNMEYIYQNVESEEAFYEKPHNIVDSPEMISETKHTEANVSLASMESFRGLNLGVDLVEPVGEACDYIVPQVIHNITAIPDSIIDTLSQDDVKVLIWELKIAYRKLIEKNRSVCEMIDEMERLALKIKSKMLEPVILKS